MICPACGMSDRADPVELDQTAVMELAAAIARGDSDEAATCLDALLRDYPPAAEWAERARRSRMAEAV